MQLNDFFPQFFQIIKYSIHNSSNNLNNDLKSSNISNINHINHLKIKLLKTFISMKSINFKDELEGIIWR